MFEQSNSFTEVEIENITGAIWVEDLIRRERIGHSVITCCDYDSTTSTRIIWERMLYLTPDRFITDIVKNKEEDFTSQIAAELVHQLFLFPANHLAPELVQRESKL
uniref:Uncharacterized protein n=1 Tax=Oryza brachyantha TaxID=4533 RepID=J3N9Y5_ORYBR